MFSEKDFCQHEFEVLKIERFDDMIDKIGRNNFMSLFLSNAIIVFSKNM